MTQSNPRVTVDIEIPIQTHGKNKISSGGLDKFINLFNDRPVDLAIPVYINLNIDESNLTLEYLMNSTDKIVGWIVELSKLENGNILSNVEIIDQHGGLVKQILEDENSYIRISPLITGQVVEGEIRDFIFYALVINT